jgi:hypothetical protein
MGGGQSHTTPPSDAHCLPPLQSRLSPFHHRFPVPPFAPPTPTRWRKRAPVSPCSFSPVCRLPEPTRPIDHGCSSSYLSSSRSHTLSHTHTHTHTKSTSLPSLGPALGPFACSGPSVSALLLIHNKTHILWLLLLSLLPSSSILGLVPLVVSFPFASLRCAARLPSAISLVIRGFVLVAAAAAAAAFSFLSLPSKFQPQPLSTRCCHCSCVCRGQPTRSAAALKLLFSRPLIPLQTGGRTRLVSVNSPPPPGGFFISSSFP